MNVSENKLFETIYLKAYKADWLWRENEVKKMLMRREDIIAEAIREFEAFRQGGRTIFKLFLKTS